MAQPLAAPYSYFADSNGAPLAGGKIYTYIAGTTTPQASYTDSTAITPLANPVILDSAGRAQIWLSGTYKIVVKDSLDNTISTTDNITALSNSGDMMKSTYDPANIGEQLVGLTAVQTLTNKTLTTPTVNQPNIVGVTTNSSAAAGSVGEYISSNIASGSAVSLTTNTAANVTSLSLTAGDWDVWGNIGFAAAGGTVPVAYFTGINTTSATIPSDAGSGACTLESGQTFSAGASNIITAGFTRILIATTTTVYLVAKAQFTTSTMTAYGFIGARRVR